MVMSFQVLNDDMMTTYNFSSSCNLPVLQAKQCWDAVQKRQKIDKKNQLKGDNIPKKKSAENPNNVTKFYTQLRKSVILHL